MKKVSPEKFLLGREYPQVKGYSEKCAEIVHKLLELDPKDLAKAFKLVQEEIKANLDLFAPADNAPDRSQHTRTRSRDVNGEENKPIPAFTVIYRNEKYFKQVSEDLKLEELRNLYNCYDADIGGIVDAQITYTITNDNPNVDPIIIPLTRVSNCINPYTGAKYPNERLGEITFIYPQKDFDEKEGIYLSENIWSECSRLFSIALNEDLPKKVREKSAYTFYGLAAHDLPVDLLTSPMLRTMLEYLAVKVGFDEDLGITKEGYNISVFALTRTPEAFAEMMMDQEKRAKIFEPLEVKKVKKGKEHKKWASEQHEAYREKEDEKTNIIFQIIDELKRNPEPVVFLEDYIAAVKEQIDRFNSEVEAEGSSRILDDETRLKMARNVFPNLKQEDLISAIHFVAMVESANEQERIGFMAIKGNSDNYFIRLRIPNNT